MSIKVIPFLDHLLTYQLPGTDALDQKFQATVNKIKDYVENGDHGFFESFLWVWGEDRKSLARDALLEYVHSTIDGEVPLENLRNPKEIGIINAFQVESAYEDLASLATETLSLLRAYHMSEDFLPIHVWGTLTHPLEDSMRSAIAAYRRS